MFVIEDTRINLDRGRIDFVVGRQVEAAARRAAWRTRERIQENIRTLGRIDTGEMLDSFIITSNLEALHPRMFVSSTAEHTVYQEKGTRAHGPVKASHLVFTPKGSSTVVFAKWVRGVTPGRFIERAVNRISVADFAP